jgi:hypothetical protein
MTNSNRAETPRPRSETTEPSDVETAELRREAAELLARSPWWQREQPREELLSRRWHRPQPDRS